MKLLWVVINFLQIFGVSLWTALWTSTALLLRLLTGDTRVPLAMARRIWAPGVLWAVGAQLEVCGLENVDFSRPHLFVMNHQSSLDVPAAFEALPVGLHFVVKEELRRVPFLGWYISAMKMVYVNRERGKQSLAMVRQVESLIAEGGSVLSFPEGTRSRDGSVRPFKSGVFLPAIEVGIPVVPVALSGARHVVPVGGVRTRPGRLRLAVGKPIETGGLTPQERRQLAQQARLAVVALLEELEGRPR